MTFKSVHCLTLGAASLLSICFATSAHAACCGGGTTAYYQPYGYTAYSPVAYQTYYSGYSGWYPGYYLDRIRARLWGSPSTYVAAYPSTYVASYPSTYYASYPAYTAGYATSYAYAPASSCSTCTANYSPCTTCASPCSTCVQQVTMRPVCGCETCTPACESCSGCSACGTSGVSQVSYEQSSGCTTCGNGGYQGAQAGTTIVVPNGTVVTPGSQHGMSSGDAQPTLDPNMDVGPRSNTSQRPTGESQQPIAPEPGTDTNGDDLEKGFQGEGSENSSFFEAPQLFNPKDRAAQRRIAPVRTALYEQPASFHRASTVRTKITARQAAQDALGWTSASK